jgi:hypothetical protein
MREPMLPQMLAMTSRTMAPVKVIGTCVTRRAVRVKNIGGRSRTRIQEGQNDRLGVAVRVLSKIGLIFPKIGHAHASR